MFTLPSFKTGTLVLAAGIAAAGCTSAVAGYTPAPAEQSCSVELTKSGRMVGIEATLSATKSATGTYRFTIKKSGRGGSANISQGGMFSIRAGETKTLGSSMMNGKPGDIDATLSVIANGVEIECDTRD
jgi:hypothetical protein